MQRHRLSLARPSLAQPHPRPRARTVGWLPGALESGDCLLRSFVAARATNTADRCLGQEGEGNPRVGAALPPGPGDWGDTAKC